MNKLKILSYILLYITILTISYIFVVSEYYAYAGLIINFSISKYVGMLLLVLLSVSIIPFNKKPSTIAIYIHLVIMVIPFLLLYSLTDQAFDFMIVSYLLFLLEIIVMRYTPDIRIIWISNSNRILERTIILFTVFVYFSMIKANGLPTLEALNLLRVYNVREVVNYPFLMGYFVPWQAKIINPYLIVKSYLDKNIALLVFSIGLEILIFLIAAQKSFLFIPFGIIIVLRFFKKKNFILQILKTSFWGVSLSLAVYYLFDKLTLVSLFIRRFLFAPALIKYQYHDFFSKNTFLFMSNGIVGKLFNLKSLYELPPNKLIGLLYYNSPEMNVNAGYLADAYANFGFGGMFSYTLIFIVVLKLIDSLSVGDNTEIAVGLMIFSIISLNDVSLMTSLLTGGLLLMLIILYLNNNGLEKRQ